MKYRCHYYSCKTEVTPYGMKINVIIGSDTKVFEYTWLTTDSAKSKIVKFSKITTWVKLNDKQHHSKVLLNSFPMNGHTLGFCTWSQKLKDFVSPKVSLWESKG